MDDPAETSSTWTHDTAAWQAIMHWKQRKLAGQKKQLVPAPVCRYVSTTGATARNKLESLPGAERFEPLFADALRGLTDFSARAARASLRTEAVIHAYQKHGYSVESLADIRALSLADIDKVKPRLDLAYIATSTVESAAAGLAVSGGQILACGGAVKGAGAGAGPGAATVVGVIAADAAPVLVASQRVVAHVAAYYGYDLNDPAEQLVATAALSVGTASQQGKAAAYTELNKVIQGLARRQTWQELNRSSVTRVVSQVYKRLGHRLTKRKLGQAIPAIGIVIGAGANAGLLAKIHGDAEHLYRERFLRERYGLAPKAVPVATTDSADTVAVSEIIDAEIINDPSTGAKGDGE